MFKNYFKIAFRNFGRHKVFSLINVLGLSIGISASLVIYLIVHYEFTFDKFEKNRSDIYRVSTDMKFAGNTISFAGVPSPLPDAARSEIMGLDLVAGFHLAQGKNFMPPEVAERDFEIIFKHGLFNYELRIKNYEMKFSFNHSC